LSKSQYPSKLGSGHRDAYSTCCTYGDLKFDNTPINEPVADYAKIADIGRLGVDILLSDSTNSLQKGHPISESEVADSLRDIVERASGRVIVASYAGLVGRTYQLIKIAEDENRKVAIAGYVCKNTLKIAEEINYIKPKKGTIVPIQKINRYKDNNVLILATGAQGEDNAALARMAEGTYKGIELKKGDTIIISAGTIPGNNANVQNLIDKITATGAVVHRNTSMDFFTSGHGYQEDQKIMINLVKPKYFMPIHGFQYFLREHARTAQVVNIPESNIIIAKRGSVISGNKYTGFRQVEKFAAVPTLVSGLGIGDVGSQVLSERQQLGNHGVIVISGLINAKQELVDMPIVQTRGFIYVRNN
jgi:ribonuclease J